MEKQIIFHKSSILLIFRIFIVMKTKMKNEDKRVKLSITISPKINDIMVKNMTNKSKLIEKLLKEYYGI